MKISHSTLSVVAATLLVIIDVQAWAFTVGLGTCPTVTPAAVTADPFANTPWFEVRRSPSKMEYALKCVSYAFGAAAGNPVTHSVTITGTRIPTRRQVSISGTLTQSAADAAANTFTRWTATYQAAWPFSAFLPSPYPSSYTVAGVDAANPPTWLALYSCHTFGPIYIRNVWILTSSQTPTAATVSTAVAAVSALGIPTSNLKTIIQSNC